MIRKEQKKEKMKFIFISAIYYSSQKKRLLDYWIGPFMKENMYLFLTPRFYDQLITS